MNCLRPVLRRAAIACALVVFTLAFATPEASGQYTEQVRRQLDRASQIVQNEGYRTTHDYEFDSMNDDATDRFTVTLNQGTSYKVLVACDNDCSDVDAKLFDENGNEVDADTSTDDVPILDVTPSWTGQFTVEVKMYACSSNPCFYGIAVFGKNTGARGSSSNTITPAMSSGSSGDGTYTAQVRAQLDRASQIVQNEGYRTTHDYEFDSANDDATERFTVTLNQGTSYKVLVACDNDCSDVDAKLFDENGNEVDADTSTDDVPILDVTPSWTGQFTVEVKMYACSSNPCFYGIAIFGKNSNSKGSLAPHPDDASYRMASAKSRGGKAPAPRQSAKSTVRAF